MVNVTSKEGDPKAYLQPYSLVHHLSMAGEPVNSVLFHRILMKTDCKNAGYFLTVSVYDCGKVFLRAA